MKRKVFLILALLGIVALVAYTVALPAQQDTNLTTQVTSPTAETVLQLEQGSREEPDCGGEDDTDGDCIPDEVELTFKNLDSQCRHSGGLLFEVASGYEYLDENNTAEKVYSTPENDYLCIEGDIVEEMCHGTVGFYMPTIQGQHWCVPLP